MGRNSRVEEMSAAQNSAVDNCIRQHRFINITWIQAELAEKGIAISRAALQRYMHKLKDRDRRLISHDTDTVIVIMQRSTGVVFNLTTTASMEQVIAQIHAIPAPV